MQMAKSSTAKKKTPEPKKEWKVRSGARLSQANAEVLKPLLDELADLSTEEMEEEGLRRSAPKDSPTHHLFEWDNKKAGHEYRLSQMRQYIGAFVLVDERVPENNVRAFPSIKTYKGSRQYVPMGKVLSSKELTAQRIAEAVDRLHSWSRSYGDLADVPKLKNIFKAISDLS